MQMSIETERKIFEIMKGRQEPEIVSICGWCPDARERTLALKKEGKTVSHGMCPSCKTKFEQGR